MPFRAAVALLLCAVAARADVETLLRRAETRVAHGNEEGARELLKQAASEAPTDGRVLGRLADMEPWGEATRHFEYLMQATPLAPVVASGLLHELRGRVIEVPGELLAEVERATLLPSEDTEEAAGPWRAWDLAERLPPALPSAGPLRCEASGCPGPSHRGMLRAVAERFVRERLEDAACWAELAVLLKQIGDQAGAEDALARAQPRSLNERLVVGECAMRVTTEPHAWWRENGPPLLAAVCEGADQAFEGHLDDFCRQALDVLPEARDLEGLVALVRSWTACNDSAYAPGLHRAVVRELNGTLALDEAYLALGDDSDPVRACLRATILREMLQDDRCIETLERAAESWPDDPAPCACIEDFCGDCRIPTLRLRAIERLREIARRSGQPLYWDGELVDLTQDLMGTEAALSRTRELLRQASSLQDVRPLAGFWADRPSGPTLAIDLLDAIERLRFVGEKHQRKCDLGDTLRICLPAGQTTRWLSLLADATREEGIETGRELAHSVVQGEVYAPVRGLLAAFAGIAAPSEAQDAFLRELVDVSDAARDIPLPFARLRATIDADPGFLRLPSAAYVLSMLQDRIFDRDRLPALRRAAYLAGCRAPGLLRDMVRAGEDAPECDATELRLVRALRSAGVGDLVAFLDDDEASQDQLGEALRELARRKGASSAGSASPMDSEEARGLLRLTLQFIDARPQAGSAARAAATLLEEPSVSNVDIIYRSRKSQAPTLHAAIERHLGPLFPASTGDPWTIEVSDSPEGRACAARGGDLVANLRASAARHPLDLRWVDWETSIQAPGPTVPRSKQQVAEELAPARSRNPDFLRERLSESHNAAEATRLASEYVAARRADPPALVISDLSIGDKEVWQLILRELAPRCRTVGDLHVFSYIAHHYGSPGLSVELDAEIMLSSDPGARYWAFQRERARADYTLPPLRSRSWAVWEGWTEEQARDIWADVASDAADAGRSDLAIEALERIWRDYPLDSDQPSGGCLSIGFMGLFREGGALRKLAWEMLDAGHAPDGLLYYLHDPVQGDEADRRAHLRASRQLFEHRIAPRRWWIESIPEKAPGETLAAFRDVFGGSVGASFVRKVRLGLEAAGRRDEALACVDEWARAYGSFRASSIEGLFDLQGGSLTHHPDGTAHEVPEQVFAARLLDSPDRTDESIERLAAAAEATDDVYVKVCCHLATARRFLAAKRLSEAVPSLFFAMRRSKQHAVRVWAHGELVKCHEDAASRPFLAAILLDEFKDQPAPPREDVEEWERTLRHEDSRSREAAGAEILHLGVRAVPLLRELRLSADPEVRARAEGLLEDLARP